MELSPSAHVDTFARDHLPPTDAWPIIEFTTPDLQYPERLNAGSALIDSAIARAADDRPAVRTPDGVEWTYAQLRQHANEVAQVLVEDLGMVPGNRVLLRMPNNPWMVAAWLGVLKAGGVAVTTVVALRVRELTPIAEKTQPTIALVDHRFIDDVNELGNTALPNLRVIPVGSDEPEDLVALAAKKSGDFTAVDTAADDVALFCPTSGSTGVPKIATHFHRDIMSIDNTFGKHVLAMRADDVAACTAPFAFTFGLGMLVVFPLRVGASSLLTESATPAVLANLVQEHGVTVLATAPTAYKQILVAGLGEKLRGVRRGVSAGEHIPQQTWERLRDEVGLKIIDGIGATELLHIFISAADADIRPGATGKPVPGYRATILGLDGTEASDGVEGRLAVIGPVGCRYLADERQSTYVQGGWNITGDTFTRDADGYFFYQARTDNMIVSSGYNIAGPEIEAVLDAHPDIVEAAVVARPDEDRGSVVCAFVVLREGVEASDERARAIQDYVKGQLAPYKYPRDLRFVDALPRNTSGKLQHFKLRQQVQGETTS